VQHLSPDLEEHELPCLEGVLAGTLALMTGYSQALQAALDPQHRLAMGGKIHDNLSLLLDHPQLSLGFRQVLLGLQRRWDSMSRCTEEAAPLVESAGPRLTDRSRFHIAAPKRLQ
jgi:hypothetical protein